MAKSNEGWEMLTVEDAREIIDNAESNAAFRKALRLEEWGYIRDPEAEKMSRAAYLVSWHHEKLITEIAERPIVAAKIVILKQKAMLRR